MCYLGRYPGGHAPAPNAKPVGLRADGLGCLWEKRRLFRENRFRRAGREAGTAVDAEFRVDLIGVAFGDCSLGAFVFARAASGALVGDFVSHNS